MIHTTNLELFAGIPVADYAAAAEEGHSIWQRLLSILGSVERLSHVSYRG
jgi:hypothetical protein